MLGDNMNSLLELYGESILLEEGSVSLIDPLGTLLGHQRRTRYRYQGGGFSADCPETGFFTREYKYPADRQKLVIAFCEAVREGFDVEAASYMTVSLKMDFSIDEIRNFLGNFDCCRPPLSDRSGRLIGLIETGSDGVACARLYEFAFEDELIADISEA